MSSTVSISKTLSISREFSETPGPRCKEEGEFSGEEFLERLLLPAYEQALADGGALLVDLDGTEGYATSFLESAFGGLARKHGASDILSRVHFKADDEPYLIVEIKKYVTEARK
jgi:hypothetical protein